MEPAIPSQGDDVVTCPHVDRCGGCPILALPYSEQLLVKRGRVTRSMSRYSTLDRLVTEPVLAAEPITGYRTRAKLMVAGKGHIGLYAKGGGHQVVDIPGCRVLSPVLLQIAAALRRRTLEDEERGGPLASIDAPGGGLRAIDLRELRGPEGAGGARALVTLVVQRERMVQDIAKGLDVLRSAARELMLEVPSIVGVAVNFHEGQAPQILGAETQLLSGAPSYPDRIGDSIHHATFGSFVQAHRSQAARVHALVAEALQVRPRGARIRVLDLYGGSGAIALSLARAGARVKLLESFAPAVSQTIAAAEAQGLALEADCADVAEGLRSLLRKGERFDAAVVNPPRRGMSPAAREGLARLRVGTVVYVSCDPDTLARDLDHLARLGFEATILRPLDMIPLTDEVETIAVLRRAAVPTPRVIFEDDELIVVVKAPNEPVLSHSEHASSLLERVHLLPSARAAVPVTMLETGTSGLVLLAKSEEARAAWAASAARPDTRRIFVAAARGITPSKGTVTRDLREDGRPVPARTRFRRLAIAAGHSVLRLIPEQGRTHQIRRHLAAIGHPVLGDDRYGHAPSNRFFEEKNGLDRTFLHCVRVEIAHARTGQRMIFEAPIHGDLLAVLDRTSGPETLKFLEHKNALGSAVQLPATPDSSGHSLARIATADEDPGE